jgi:hypothetical protein
LFAKFWFPSKIKPLHYPTSSLKSQVSSLKSQQEDLSRAGVWWFFRERNKKWKSLPQRHKNLSIWIQFAGLSLSLSCILCVYKFKFKIKIKKMFSFLFSSRINELEEIYRDCNADSFSEINSSDSDELMKDSAHQLVVIL